MPKLYKPTTPSRRHMTGYDFSQLTKIEPLKSLKYNLRRSLGRNNASGNRQKKLEAQEN